MTEIAIGINPGDSELKNGRTRCATIQRSAVRYFRPASLAPARRASRLLRRLPTYQCGRGTPFATGPSSIWFRSDAGSPGMLFGCRCRSLPRRNCRTDSTRFESGFPSGGAERLQPPDNLRIQRPLSPGSVGQDCVPRAVPTLVRRAVVPIVAHPKLLPRF
jgi:hypothetical protein